MVKMMLMEVKDITVDSFLVSAGVNNLLKNASMKIAHGKSYGLVESNGTEKSTLLKLIEWRKIPVAKNIDILLVELEIVGDELEALVQANEEFVRLRQEVATLQKEVEDVGDTGEKLL